MDDVASLLKTSIVVGCGLLFSTTWNSIAHPPAAIKRKYVVLPHLTDAWGQIEVQLSTKATTLEDLKVFYGDDLPRFFTLFLENYSETAEAIHFFSDLLPFIQKMALKLIHFFPSRNSLFYLIKRQEDQISLSREEICCLLANAFLCTFPEPEGDEKGFNFDSLLRSSLGSAFNSCLCILNYFRRFQECAPKGQVVFKRQLLIPEKTPDWDTSEKKISKVTIMDTGSIESDESSEFHAIFSDKWLGGGLLHAGGYAQEEMAFILRPESIVSLLLIPTSEDLAENEAIVISGAECFSSYSGFGATFTYTGTLPPENRQIFEPTNSLSINLVCVDALSCTGIFLQFEQASIHRELCKLYTGVYNWREKTDKEEQIYATSHWGCGINGGNRQLKAIEQLLSLSEAGLDIHYYMYGSKKFSQKFSAFLKFLYEVDATVGEVATALFSYKDKRTYHSLPRQTLFEHIIETITLLRKRGTVTRG
eukprot:TRINITY_DN5935_c0_g1_i1.p1 TRINITY_DN5935_c0_g1~~TRINITY_DN5935_c0_g1_i1.p1  ORF type:complete len:486 (-),score=78.24 TRINITY_DN5935_c0_g1_i1:88-1521(-)